MNFFCYNTAGKVNPSHGCCYISYDGEEIAKKDFEVGNDDISNPPFFLMGGGTDIHRIFNCKRETDEGMNVR